MGLFDLTSIAEIRRNSLINAVKNLSVQQLDWRIKVNSVTVGSSLLHLAGFEFLTHLAMKHKAPPFSVLYSKEWEVYKNGHLRECVSDPPFGFTADYYIDLLVTNRNKILSMINKSKINFDKRYFVFYGENDPFDVDQNGVFKEPSPSKYKLFLSNELILLRLPQHDNYHRGQITLLKYLMICEGI